LTDFNRKNEHIDTITFAGNGEPTMHPQFAEIIDDVIELRNSICPTTKVSVLSNATLINKPKIFDALQKIDNNILKLDSGIEDTINLINQPVTKFSLEKTIENLRQFKGELTVQTLFFRGKYKGVEIDNTSDKEVAAWIEAIKKIKPKSVMIYTLDRPTPVKELYKADEQRLKEIAAIVENLGIKTQING
jgi:radical SAM domain protein